MLQGPFEERQDDKVRLLLSLLPHREDVLEDHRRLRMGEAKSH